ncbi:MAG: ABC transporter ATP-binding protein [Armatimonadetes bacterium]|nr:ABC transporter ATP-binding protein [Armatimonadota bacterium]
MNLGPLSPFLIHAKRQWPRVGAAMLLSYVVAGLNLTLPVFYSRLTDDVLRPPDGSQAQQVHALFVITIGMVVVLLVRRVAQSVSSFLAASVTQRMAVDVRRDVYVHLQRLRLGFYDDQRTGALVSNITNDITAIQFLLHDGMVQVFTAPVVVVGAAALVFWRDWLLGTAAFAVFPVLYAVLALSSGRIRDLSDRNQTVLSRLTTQFIESVANVRIVRAFCRTEYETSRFVEANDASLDMRLINIRAMSVVEFVAELVVLLGFAGVLLLGGLRITSGQMSVGGLIAIVAYLGTMRSAVNAVSLAYSRYQQAVGAATRLLEVLAEPLPTPVACYTEPPAQWLGALSIRHLSFAYPDGTVVFEDAEAEIAPGECVALVGPSGSGKSTLASLALGLYEPQAGCICIDGIDIRQLAPEVLLEAVSIVPQEVGLFSGTVRENIAYARLDASDDEVIAASRAANAHEFIENLVEGYDTFVGDQGVKLSGGQRQRIAIARALLRNPRILILDEATSHVDAHTAALVTEALTRLMVGRTVLIIAHHESALKDVDRVLVLEEHRLVVASDTRGLTQA